MPQIQESVLETLSDDLATSFFESGVSSDNIIVPKDDDNEDEQQDDEQKNQPDNSKKKKNSDFKNPIIDFDTSDLIDGLNEDEGEDEQDVTKPVTKSDEVKKPGRPPKVSEELNFDINSFFEDETLSPFEDDVPVKTVKDLKELIIGNRDFAVEEARTKALDEYKATFPDSVRKIMDYVENGGSDFDNFLKALGKTREITDLDVENDTKEIIRQYYSLQDYTPQEIEEEIESLLDLGEDKLKQTAARLKPRLDKMQDEIVEQQLEVQKQYKAQQDNAQRYFVKNVVDTLKKGSLGSLKLSREEQNDVYKALIEERYETPMGGVTNRLGAILDKIQFSDQPDYALLAKITMYASDPEAFEKKIREEIKKDVTAESIRKIKQTQQGSGKSSTHVETPPNRIKRLDGGFRNPFV